MPEPAKVYRRKPGIVEVRQYVAGMDDDEITDLVVWSGGMLLPGARYSDEKRAAEPPKFLLPTVRGVEEVAIDDYIVRGSTGDFYPIDPYLFHATHEEIR